jgi:hypothetical protein
MLDGIDVSARGIGVLGAIALIGPARAAAAEPPSRLVAVGAWTAVQLVPSPLLVVGSDHVGGGLRWQITPLVYSFGIAAEPWRSFVVSPVARHSGSIELYAAPEWMWSGLREDDDEGWRLRAGLRVYLPILEHGDRLSWSLGAAYARDHEHGASLDAGLYTLYGIFGVTLTVPVSPSPRDVIIGLSVRYF